MRGRDLQRVVKRIRVISKELETGDAQTWEASPRVEVRGRVLSDGVGCAVGSGERNGIGSGVVGLVEIPGLTQMSALRANIAGFEHPTSSEVLLYAEVPLLRTRVDVVQWNIEPESIDAVAAVDRSLRRVGGRAPACVYKSKQARIDRHK